MKIKTSELKKSTLGWAIAKCEGHELLIEDGDVWFEKTTDYRGNWELCGLILEREKINLEYPRNNCPWQANMWHEHLRDGSHFSHGSGDTAFEAAMRCYVASKLGDEIEIPKELI